MNRCNLSEQAIAELEMAEKLATPAPWRGFRTGVLHGPDWVVTNVPDAESGIMSKGDAWLIEALRNYAADLIAAAKWVKWAEQTIEKASRDNDTWCETLTEMDELRKENEALKAKLRERDGAV